MFTIPPLERISSGKNACVTLTGPSNLTSRCFCYFLAYRDAAKACKGLSHQEAHTITVGVLIRYGVVKILSKGEAGLNGAKAAEFQYLSPETESAEEDDDEIPF